MYAIKDETLTALGDAVRSKVLGVDNPNEEYKKTWVLSTNSNRTLFITPKVKATKYKVIISSVVVGPNYRGSGLVLNIYNDDDIGNSNLLVYSRMFKGNEPFDLPDETEITVQEFAVDGFVGHGTDSFEVEIKVIPLDENGNEFKYTPLEMVDKINELETVPSVAFNLSDSFDYRFMNRNWDWFLEAYGDKITTSKITGGRQCFSNSYVKEIPFDLNFSPTTSNYYSITSMFQNCNKLTSLPKITNLRLQSCDMLLDNCHMLREIPEDFYKDWDFSYLENITSEYSGQMSGMFGHCRSLRKVPMEMINKGNKYVYYGYSPYGGSAFNCCYALDELVGLPLFMTNANWSSNAFASTLGSCCRLKELTFETNEDGTPIIMKWKNQTISLNNYIGYASGINSILNYNSGITADKEVKDDATYQALKNDPDWFSCDINYSRYNHDSAVNTINSLPDCSATGTNTIKFKGASGALTDGGAINTLTEEEIAVAAAKGWTVSFV
jgi:hypothetical protein